ncbi:MAG: hypothetical protein COA62_15815 [Rhodobiaceae bacterium]|nr:MAG: hypothetical protein COA62_15815 [Rhodobiaceae bacterium]
MFKIKTADMRAAENRGRKILVLGESGVGKTSLLWSLPLESTLFVDIEAGDLAVEGWQGDSLEPTTWIELCNLAVFVGGPNPEAVPGAVYSQGHYDAVAEEYAAQNITQELFQKYDTLFIDSLTDMSRLCFQWCLTQPESWNKEGVKNTMGTYGLLGVSMIAMLKQIQKTRHMNVIFLGILDEFKDENGAKTFVAQIEGSKVGREIPGIVDEVFTMAILSHPETGETYRALVTNRDNRWRFPAKDRSGRLNDVEEPHLGRVMEKMNNKAPAGSNLVHSVPSQDQTTEQDQGQPVPAESSANPAQGHAPTTSPIPIPR